MPASNVVDVSALSDFLTKDRKDYGKVFGLKMADGFGFKKDFRVLGINQEISLVRDELDNLTQPGRTGVTNFSTTFIRQKERIGKLKPAKVDLKLTEEELYKLRISYLGQKEPGNPRDINSLPGRTYIMGRVMDGIAREVNRAIFKGVENRATGVQGGLNLFDGLDFKLTKGFTAAPAGDGDIPAGNKVVGAAASVTQANILGEINKMIAVIIGSETLIEYMDEAASLFIPPTWYGFMISALESALSNGSQIVSRNANGEYVLNQLPNTVIKPRTYMIGVNNMVWTLDGNLFWLHQDLDADVPRIKFQEVDRDLKILIDFELNVEYADGRVIVLYK